MKRTALKRRMPLRSASAGRCCGKSTFLTSAAAEAAMARAQRAPRPGSPVPRRVYQCRHGRYHLTSRHDRDVWRQLRLETLRRDGMRCVLCGAGSHLDPHHRKFKSRGGLDGFDNLLTLCRTDHDWVHAHPAAAEERGLVVPSWADPAARPVELPAFGWVLLTAGGDVMPVARGGAARSRTACVEWRPW